jgi:hypothetical protein
MVNHQGHPNQPLLSLAILTALPRLGHDLLAQLGDIADID